MALLEPAHVMKEAVKSSERWVRLRGWIAKYREKITLHAYLIHLAKTNYVWIKELHVK